MTRPVLYLIACAAGPAQYLDDGVRTAQAAKRDTCLVLSPTAATWWGPLVQGRAPDSCPCRVHFLAC